MPDFEDDEYEVGYTVHAAALTVIAGERVYCAIHDDTSYASLGLPEGLPQVLAWSEIAWHLRNRWRAEFLEHIPSVFAQVPYPGDDQVIGEMGDRYFVGKPWQGHDSWTLGCHKSDLSFFSPAAFHYYMPAFLTAALEYPHDATGIAGSVTFHFSGQSAWMHERMAHFSTEQKAVVRNFIEWEAERHGTSGHEVAKAIATLSARK